MLYIIAFTPKNAMFIPGIFEKYTTSNEKRRKFPSLAKWANDVKASARVLLNVFMFVIYYFL